jgi:hypothetical protein
MAIFFRAESTSYMSNSSFCCVLFNNNFEYTIHKVNVDPNGNFIIIDLTITNCVRLTLVNIYGPNSDNPDFYHSYRTKLIFLKIIAF